ncbi:MAG: [protein-PII] uridylyltransferase [Candidatus Nitronauta litoralis]|uniref:Bifunctional uridylyltransferase/uridylyl-removing enzyme n=1 Tax=Candidatus Nitronauta litoralis TaxID=2705533 RepID=A0A7T0BUE2_9BACT|nr:MAG: [protein-PII] uridylyltransferase [Candidatus Nitronauta litoralis]
MTPTTTSRFRIEFSQLGPLPADARERLEYYQQFKKLVQEGKDKIRNWHHGGAGGREVVQAHTALIDSVLRYVIKEVKALDTYKEEDLLDQFVLAAVGGYGRGELNPASDIDLLFLLGKKMSKVLDTFIQEVISVLWGIDLEIGHSCRTIRECQALAAEDPTVRTSMIETRHLIGNKSLYEKLVTSVRKNVLKKRAREFLDEKLKEKYDRHENGEHVSSNPEPNLKEGFGGLRDYHVALWAVAVRFGVLSFSEIKDGEVVSPQEISRLEQSVNFILRVRNELHYQTGKKGDVLTLDLQEKLAHELGYRGEAGQSAVEQFMREYFLHATTIYQVSESIFQRCLEAGPLLTKVISKFKSRDLGDGLLARKTDLGIKGKAETLFENDPLKLLTVFELCLEHGLKPDIHLKRLIRKNEFRLDLQFLEKEEVRAFIDKLLGHPQAEPVLRQMHEVGLLGRILPEFGITHCRVQYDFYHRFTSDEHALRMVHFLEELETPREEGLEKLAQNYKELKHPATIKLACLLHSLGEDSGTNGGNESCSEALKNVCHRLQLDETQSDHLTFLVNNLNSMNEAAFHKDIHQPDNIRSLAERAATPERIDLLVLYSYAELKAVAPDTWTAWKRLLLIELFHRTRNYLVNPSGLDNKPATTKASVYQALDGKVPKEEIDHHLSLMLEDYLITAGSHDIIEHIRLLGEMKDKPVVMSRRYDSNAGFYDLVMAAIQSPDMFANIIGALTAKAMNIHGAQIYTRQDNRALIHLQVDGGETFKIHGEQDEVWNSFESDLSDLMEKRKDLPTLMASRTRLTSQTDSKAAIVPKIEIDNLLENRFTFIRIEARDHPGMLYKIAQAFADFNIQIHRAKIAVRGGRGIDVFSISQHGEKVYQLVLQRKLKERIISNLFVEHLEDLQ